MKDTKYILLALIAAAVLSACSKGFLDQVPSDRINLEDVFNTRKYSERFLANCYIYMPDESRVSYYSLDGLSDDLDNSYDRPDQAQYFMYSANLGNWSASSDYFNEWSDKYIGIRLCTYFIDNIEGNKEMVKNGEYARIRQYKAEARFLRAYLAFILVRMYGPIVIPQEHVIAGDLENDDPLMNLPRDPYDDCVDWIVNELDEAAKDLPLHFTDQLSNDYGRATKAACMAVKARLLLYAASPQFNGNQYYAGVQNKDGTHLFSTSYDASKWERAAKAAKDIMDLGIFELHYSYNTDGTPNTYKSLADVFLQSWNKETIFALTTHNQENIHRHGSPRHYNGYESVGVTQSLVDEFQMANGMDISDPASGYSETGFSTTAYEDEKSGWVFAPSGTYNMWVGREARFYLNVAFNGAYCLYNNQSERYKWQLNKSGEDGIGGSWDAPRSGYVRIKGTSPAFNAQIGQSVTLPYVLYRYAEVLLNYAEALNGDDPGNTEIVRCVNLVRERAGLPGIPSGLSQEAMRNKIRHERRVELCGEQLRYYDTRRWLIAEQTDGGPFYGMNAYGDGDDFYKRTVFETRVFRKAYYLFPIPQSEINKDENLVQNPGW